jgi:hypothetical protein
VQQTPTQLPTNNLGSGVVTAQLALNVGDTVAPCFKGGAQTLNSGQRTMSIR